MKVPEPRKLKSGTWFIQLRLGGVSVPVSARSKTECRYQAQVIKSEYMAKKREITPRSELTLKEAFDQYIERKEKQSRSPATVRGYVGIRDHRFQSAMTRKVASIRDWQAIYDAESALVSTKTLNNAWSLLKTVCKKEAGVIVPEIETLETKTKERPFLDPDQIKVFVKAVADHPYRIPMLLCLSSLRSSEVQALTWDKIDLDKKTITVRGAVVPDRNNKPVFKEDNKTMESTRTVPIFIPELFDALRRVPGKTADVVTITPNWIYKTINAVCEKNCLPQVGEHGLRHSFASLCYSLGVPIKVTMQIGGWSNYGTVMKIYTHLAKKDVIKETAKLENFFAPDQNANENANDSAKDSKINVESEQ